MKLKDIEGLLPSFGVGSRIDRICRGVTATIGEIELEIDVERVAQEIARHKCMGVLNPHECAKSIAKECPIKMVKIPEAVEGEVSDDTDR